MDTRIWVEESEVARVSWNVAFYWHVAFRWHAHAVMRLTRIAESARRNCELLLLRGSGS